MATYSFDDFLKQAGGKPSDVKPVDMSTVPAPVNQSNYLTDTISSAFKGGVDQAKQGYQDFANSGGNPIKAVEGVTKSLAGGVNAALSPLAPITAPVGKGVEYLGDKISDNPAVQKFASSPAGEVTSRAAEDVSNLSTVAGAVAGGVGGAELGIKGATQAAKIAEPVVSATGRVLKNAGEKAYGVTIVPEEATSKLINTYNASKPSLSARLKDMITGNTADKPITEANTAARLGLMGTEKELGVQAERISKQLWDENLAPKLDAVKEKVNMKTFISELEKELGKETKGLRRSKLKDALDAFKEEYKNVSSISLRKLQDYKSSWAEFLPDSVYKGKPIASALKEIQNLAASKARQIIYKHVGEDGRQAYLDWGNLQSIIKSGIKSVKDPAKQSLSRDIWQFAMDKAITPIATFSGKVLYKTGEGLEFIGKKGAKTVKDALD